MKANELRIGDYFMYDDRIQVVNGVIQMNGGYRIDFKTEHKRKLVKYCHPIPITEEWLLELGFEKEHNTGTPDEYYWKGKGMSLTHELELSSSDRYYESMPVDNSIPLKYVHQLQNLYFALTGEELKIKEHEAI